MTEAGAGRAGSGRAGRYTVPGWLWIPAAAGLAFLALPLAAMVLGTDWRHFGALVTSTSALVALSLSLRTAAAATVASLVFGVPLAVVLARAEPRGHRYLRALVMLPLVLPPVVGGLALLLTYGRTGLLGRWLELGGVHIAFSTTAVVLAQTFVAMPFLVISLEGALRSGTEAYERVAATLGAAPGVVLRRVTLPLVAPGLVSGAVLAFARALGEFGAVKVVSGGVAFRTQTATLLVEERYQQFGAAHTTTAYTAALLLTVIALVALVVVAVLRPSQEKRA